MKSQADLHYASSWGKTLKEKHFLSLSSVKYAFHSISNGRLEWLWPSWMVV